MIIWLIKWCLISLILISISHYLYIFFIDKLTIPKVKDLVNKPNEKYKQMFSNLNNTLQSGSGIIGNVQNNENDMQEELQNYLNELNQNSHNDTTNIMNSANMSSSNEIMPSNFNSQSNHSNVFSISDTLNKLKTNQ